MEWSGSCLGAGDARMGEVSNGAHVHPSRDPCRNGHRYSQRAENDFRDAEAIAEGATAPTMSSPPARRADQLDCRRCTAGAVLLERAIAVPERAICRPAPGDSLTARIRSHRSGKTTLPGRGRREMQREWRTGRCTVTLRRRTSVGKSKKHGHVGQTLRRCRSGLSPVENEHEIGKPFRVEDQIFVVADRVVIYAPPAHRVFS
jgi:hypothetical protein